jgi:hypothetical protein
MNMRKLQLAIMVGALAVTVQARASWSDITLTGNGSDANGQINVVDGSAISGFLNTTAGTDVGSYTLTPVPTKFSPMAVGPTVPEPTTIIAGALLLLPFGASALRILRKTQTA